VALSSDGGTVFTASRDATVRSWQAHEEESSPVGQWKGTYEGHSNWVNDVLTIEDRLVTCSSDHCVSLWNAHPQPAGRPPHTRPFPCKPSTVESFECF
jgi:WD40 repeat protein